MLCFRKRKMPENLLDNSTKSPVPFLFFYREETKAYGFCTTQGEGNYDKTVITAWNIPLNVFQSNTITHILHMHTACEYGSDSAVTALTLCHGILWRDFITDWPLKKCLSYRQLSNSIISLHMCESVCALMICHSPGLCTTRSCGEN